MVLGELINLILDTEAPVYEKATWFYSVLKPLESHINCLGFLWTNGGVDDLCGSRII